jgi:hypothetical protein
MSNLTPILTLQYSTEATVAWMMRQLSASGFQVERTFDLQAARLAHADCPCPHHGTRDCTCQMVVLIVHSEGQLTTIVAHGQEKRTSLSLVDGTNQVIDKRVFQALLPALGEFGC